MRLVYLHLPRFPVQRRVLEVPSLAQKPFILVREHNSQRVVVFASTSALKLGVRMGMSFAAARAIEPSLPQSPYEPANEEKALVALGESLLSFGPAFELSEPDGLFLDAGASHLFGGEGGLCEQVLQHVQGLGFKGRAALASEKFTARALARYGEKRITVVPKGLGLGALSPLPLAALEGMAAPVRGPLVDLGLKTLGELERLAPASVVARLGAPGLKAQRLVRGEDDARLVPFALEERVEEAFNLEWPAEALEPVLFALKVVIDRVSARLVGRKRAAVRLTLQMKLENATERAVPLTLARPSAQSKLLLELSRHQLSECQLDNPVTGVAVRVEESCEDRGQQLNLGDSPEGDAALEVVISRLTTALGEDALFSSELRETHRPEQAYRAERFSPPRREKGLLAEAQLLDAAVLPDAAGKGEEVNLERPIRLLKEAQSLDVELGQSGQLLGARLLGKRRKVMAIAGPERLGGEWWAVAFSRDYYRVHFEGVGPMWIYRDGQSGGFYLQGMFD